MTSAGYSLGDAYGSVIISTNVATAMDEAVRQFDAGIAGMSASMQAWGQSLTQVGAQLSILTEPLRGMISEGFTAVGDFDQIMTEISARTGLTGEALDGLRQTARQMGVETVFSAQQAGEALLQLLTSGMNVEEALATLPAVLTAAAASGEDLGRTADGVTDIMAIFSLGVEDAQMVVDVLAQAAGASSASMGSLVDGFTTGGAQARLFGMSVKETAATLAIFAENGIKGSEAGTQLKSMLQNMGRQTNDVIGIWNNLGVSMYDAQGNARDLEDVIKDLDAALDTRTMEEQNEIMTKLGGSYGIMGLSALRNGISISEMSARMDEQAGASSIAAQMMGTLNTMVNSLSGSWTTFLEVVLAPTVEEYIKPIIQAGIDLLAMMTTWAQENPEIAQTFAILAMAISALGPVLIGIGLALSIGGAALGLLLSPIALITGALFTLGVVFRNQIGAITQGFSKFVNDLRGGSIEGALLGAFGQDGDLVQVTGWFQHVLEAFGMTEEAAQNLSYSLGTSFRQIYDTVTPFFQRLSNAFSMAIGNIEQFQQSINNGAGTIQALTETIGAMITSFLYGIGVISDIQELGTVRAAMFETIESIFTAFSNAWTMLGNLKNSMTAVWNMLRSSGVGVFDTIRAEIDIFTDKILGFFGVSAETSSAIEGWLTTAVTNIERVFNAARGVFSSVTTWLSGLNVSGSGIGQAVGPLYEIGSWLLALTNPFSLAFKVLTTLGVDFIAMFEDVGKGISKFFDVLSGGGSLQDAFSSIFGGEMVDGVLSGVSVVTQAINDFINLLVGIWDYVSPGLTYLANWFLQDALPAIWSLITNAILPALQAVGSFLAQLWALVEPSLSLFIQWFLEGLTGVVIPAIEQLIQVVTRIWTDVSPFLLQLADWFLNDVLPTVLSFINDVAIPVIQDFINILVSIWEVVSPVLEQLYNWFISEGLPFIMQQLENGRLAVQSVIDILAGIWGFVQQGVEDLKAGLDAAIKWIDTTVVQPFLSLIQGIINLISGIWTSVQTGIEALKSGIDAAMKWIDTTVIQPIRNAINGFISVLQGIWASVKPGFDEFARGVEDTLGPIFKRINDIINLVTGASTTVSAGGEINQAAAANMLAKVNGGSGNTVPYLPSHATGIDFIQRDGLVMAHAGEKIVTANQNAQDREGAQQPIMITIEKIIANSFTEGQEAARGFKAELENLAVFNG